MITNDQKFIMQLFQNKSISVKTFSHTFCLKDTLKAYEIAHCRSEGALKVLIFVETNELKFHQKKAILNSLLFYITC